MKTALTELIEHINNDYLYPHKEVRDYLDRLTNKATELLEKEKQQQEDLIRYLIKNMFNGNLSGLDAKEIIEKFNNQ